MINVLSSPGGFIVTIWTISNLNLTNLEAGPQESCGTVSAGNRQQYDRDHSHHVCRTYSKNPSHSHIFKVTIALALVRFWGLSDGNILWHMQYWSEPSSHPPGEPLGPSSETSRQNWSVFIVLDIIPIIIMVDVEVQQNCIKSTLWVVKWYIWFISVQTK